MTDSLPAGMIDVVLEGYTTSAQTVTLAVRIKPRSGSVALYLAPTDARPAFICDGPGRQVTLGCQSGMIYMRKLYGAVDVEVRAVSWG